MSFLTRLPRILLTAVFLLSLAIPFRNPPSAQAAPLTVTNANDSGAGSLRQAIIDANPGDTIDFAPAVTGVISLTSGQLAIAKNLTIAGPGTGILAVDGNNANRVFDISGGAKVFVSGLTIQRGREAAANGGAINIAGAELTLSSASVVTNSAVSGGGLYIDAASSVTITDSTLGGNSANNYGGGLFGTASSRITLNRSTVNNNAAVANWGGGLLVENSSTLSLANTTVVSNTAGGSGGGGLSVSSASAVTMTSVTLSGNTGVGIYKFGGTVAIKNTIIANNDANCGGSMTSLGNNLSSDSGCGFNQPTDLSSRDPLLGALQANEPGTTATQALLPGSPAVGAGDNAACAAAGSIDQRGIVRPQGSRCDIGAYEARTSSVVNSLLDPGPQECLTTCTLRTAAGLSENGDTVTFDPALSGTITLGAGPIRLSKRQTITGPGASILAVDGNSATRVFDILRDAQVTLSGLAVQRGTETAADGGAIRVDNAGLTLTNMLILTSTAKSGGGVYVNSGTLNVNASKISGNSAKSGGSFFGVNATDDSVSATVAGVSPFSGGGGLFAVDSTVNVNNSTLSGNSTLAGGGGLFSFESTVNVSGSTVSGNTAANDGGGVNAAYYSLVNLSNSTLSGNIAGSLGGGLAISEFSAANLINDTLSANSAFGGGGIRNTFSVVNLKNTIIAGNTVGGNCNGDIASQGYNLDSDGSCSLSKPSDLPNRDALLGPLALNMPGSTATHALLETSPAIAAADGTACAAAPVFGKDQRGVQRLMLLHCDIGAFEAVKGAALSIVLSSNRDSTVLGAAAARSGAVRPRSVEGSSIIYKLVAANAGPSSAHGAVVTASLPSELTGVAWTCTTTGGATCGKASGAGGSLTDTIGAFPPQSAATYTITGTVPAGTYATLTASAGVTPPVGVTNVTPQAAGKVLSELTWVVRSVFLPGVFVQ